MHNDPNELNKPLLQVQICGHIFLVSVVLEQTLGLLRPQPLKNESMLISSISCLLGQCKKVSKLGSNILHFKPHLIQKFAESQTTKIVQQTIEHCLACFISLICESPSEAFTLPPPCIAD